MEKIVTNAKFRVHNYNHAVLILDRLRELNGSGHFLSQDYFLDGGPHVIQVESDGKLYINRSAITEKDFNAMEQQAMTLDELYAITNVKSVPINNGEVQAEVNFDDKYISIEGIDISFRELNRLYNIINNEK